MALLVPGVDGLQVMGSPGWRMGEVLGVLTEVGGRKVFQAKSEIVEATPERIAELASFRGELNALLAPPPVLGVLMPVDPRRNHCAADAHACHTQCTIARSA